MTVNGEEVKLEKTQQDLGQFLKENGYRIDTVAVELNGEIVPKSKYPTTILKRQDTMEIVHFVGGG